jgi:RNA-splicing ligase RtcB
MTTHINQAVVYLPEKKVDPETYQLVSKMSKSSVFERVRVMPDCHSSSHCCVGMTCKINDKVIPQIVGGDIGCGISCYNLQKVIKEKQYQKYDNLVKSLIPMGEKNHRVSITNDQMIDDIYRRCN